MGWVTNATLWPLYPRERDPETHFIGGCLGPRIGLDGCGNLANTGIRYPDRLACKDSLYQLRYPDPPGKVVRVFYFRG
jgi:hypothetical protein